MKKASAQFSNDEKDVGGEAQLGEAEQVFLLLKPDVRVRVVTLRPQLMVGVTLPVFIVHLDPSRMRCLRLDLPRLGDVPEPCRMRCPRPLLRYRRSPVDQGSGRALLRTHGRSFHSPFPPFAAVECPATCGAFLKDALLGVEHQRFENVVATHTHPVGDLLGRRPLTGDRRPPSSR